MVRSGVPHSLRPYIWPRLCGAMLKKQQTNFTYKEIMKSSADDRLNSSKQIEKDLLRTLPTNVCYMSLQSTGIPRLRRILRAVAFLYPEIGTKQLFILQKLNLGVALAPVTRTCALITSFVFHFRLLSRNGCYCLFITFIYGRRGCVLDDVYNY